MTQTWFSDCPRPSQTFPWQKDEAYSHNRRGPSQPYMCMVPKCSHEPSLSLLSLHVPETIISSAKRTFREITEEKNMYTHAYTYIFMYTHTHTHKRNQQVYSMYGCYIFTPVTKYSICLPDKP